MGKVDFYVISKGRPRGTTAMILQLANVKYKIAVEPQDYDKYVEYGHEPETLIKIPCNDKGFSYVVNFCKNRYKNKPLMIIDDDVQNLYYNIEGQLKVSPSLKTQDEFIRFFEDLQKDILSTDFEIGTLGKSAFDWSYEKLEPRSKNWGGLPVFIIINSPRCLAFDFDESLAFKSDIDYALKCMYLGIKYAKFVKYLHCTRMNKSDKQTGGLSDTYRKIEILKDVNKKMLERWPMNVLIDEKKKPINGVPELRIKYKDFTSIIDLNKIEC